MNMRERHKPTLDGDYDVNGGEKPKTQRHNFPWSKVLQERALRLHPDPQPRSRRNRGELLQEAYIATKRDGTPKLTGGMSPSRLAQALRLERIDSGSENRDWVDLVAGGNEETTQSLILGLNSIGGKHIIQGDRNIVRAADPFMVGFFDKKGDLLLTLANKLTRIPKDQMTLYFLDKGGTHQIYDSVALERRAYPFCRLPELYDGEKLSAKDRARVHFARVTAPVDGHEKNILDLIYYPPGQTDAVSLERLGRDWSNNPIPNLQGTIEMTWLGDSHKRPWIRQAFKEIYFPASSSD